MSNVPDPTGDASHTSKSKSKRNKKVKSDDPVDAVLPSTTSSDPDPSATTNQSSSSSKTLFNNGVSEKLLKQLTNVMLTSGGEGLGLGRDKNKDKKCKDDYRFWRTQPVPDLDEAISDNCAIEPDKKPEEIRSEPYSLPAEFSWCELSLDDDSQLQELYDLLYQNYVEDDDHLFRFNYSKHFLKWAMQPPGWHPDWHVGLRVKKSGKLVGFIGAIPVDLQIYDTSKKLVEINFLCVHSKLRSKRMAPVLIREITRRVHLRGRFQALYTSGALLPRPVATCRYWHRPLNPRKLLDCGFSHLSQHMTLQRTIKLYRLPEAVLVKGFRQLTKADIPETWALVTKHLAQYSLHPNFTVEEFEHFFTPRDEIVNSFVVENDSHVITDFCSYYVLPSSIMKQDQHQHTCLRAAYSFYNVATVTPLSALIQDMLIIAKQLNFDVFNALDLMEHKKCLEELKFGIGDGNLHYYLYNWRCPVIPPEQVAVILH